MYAYHETSPNQVEMILHHGLKRSSRGEKGADDLIIKTDKYLDSHCPKELIEAGVSRDNTIYAYNVDKGLIVDITDGKRRDADEFIRSSRKAVLRIKVDPQRCYVSDLDKYDGVKKAIEDKVSDSEKEELACAYWEALQNLSQYSNQSIPRPEVMITYDLPPSAIERMS